MKFRKINLNNANFTKRVKEIIGSLEILKQMGFKDNN